MKSQGLQQIGEAPGWEGQIVHDATVSPKKLIVRTALGEWPFRIELWFMKSLAYGHVPLGVMRSQRQHLDEKQRRPDPHKNPKNIVCWVKLLQSANGTLACINP